MADSGILFPLILGVTMQQNARGPQARVHYFTYSANICHVA